MRFWHKVNYLITVILYPLKLILKMATLDDKLLGEKLHYYCSSSEDEEENEPKNNEDDSNVVQLNPNKHNTGPKGVLDDWRRYKQLEVEKREKDEREKLDLAKKLSLNCRSEREDSEINAELEKLENDVEDDEFIQGIDRFYALSMGCTVNIETVNGSLVQVQVRWGTMGTIIHAQNKMQLRNKHTHKKRIFYRNN